MTDPWQTVETIKVWVVNPLEGSDHGFPHNVSQWQIIIDLAWPETLDVVCFARDF
jgi:hypothetical protein